MHRWRHVRATPPVAKAPAFQQVRWRAEQAPLPQALERRATVRRIPDPAVELRSSAEPMAKAEPEPE